MGTAKGLTLGIAAGVILAVAVVAAVMSGTFTTSIAAGNTKITTPDGKESVLVSDNPFSTEKKEPILVYNACDTNMLTDEGRTNQQARVICNINDINGTLPDDRDSKTRFDTFRFAAPAKLVNSGLLCFSCDTRLYVYGNNDYELEFLDEVGAKRYPVRLYELPQ